MRKSPRISSFPLIYYHFSLCLFKTIVDAEWTGLEGDAALLLLVSSGLDVTARRIRTRVPGGHRLPENQKSPRAPKCAAHLRLACSGQFEFMPPPELLHRLHAKCGALDLVTGAA